MLMNILIRKKIQKLILDFKKYQLYVLSYISFRKLICFYRIVGFSNYTTVQNG